MTEVERLPRGRHKLSRADVAGQQRQRMLTALADVLTERGYANTPVAAVIERAGVSRETFYQQFASKQDCFIAAFEDAVSDVATALFTELGATAGTPLERFDRGLRVYLATLAAEPAKTRLFLVETYAAGPEAIARRAEIQAQFVDGIAALFGARSKAKRAVCEALVGAIVALVTARIVSDDVAGLAAIRAPIVELAGATLAAATTAASGKRRS
jgi:AcrR family transcriptional regulator